MKYNYKKSASAIFTEALPALLGLFINMDVACVPVCQRQGIPVNDIGHMSGLPAVGLSILHVHVFFLCIHCIGKNIYLLLYI